MLLLNSLLLLHPWTEPAARAASGAALSGEQAELYSLRLHLLQSREQALQLLERTRRRLRENPRDPYLRRLEKSYSELVERCDARLARVKRRLQGTPGSESAEPLDERSALSGGIGTLVGVAGIAGAPSMIRTQKAGVSAAAERAMMEARAGAAAGRGVRTGAVSAEASSAAAAGAGSGGRTASASARTAAGGAAGRTLAGKAGAVAINAGKWALASAGVTVTAQVMDQLRNNGWNVSRIDWRRAVDPLMHGEFWGGTAGSFLVSGIAASVVPGGIFLKTLAAVTGASIGWQLGTGNIASTDWLELGATSLGAAMGMVLGSALGPVGTFIGGVAGHLASKWLLDKLKEKFAAWCEARLRPDPTKDALYGEETDEYAAPARVHMAGPDEIEELRRAGVSAARLKRMLDRTYMEIVSLSEQSPSDPETAARLAALRRRYGGIRRLLWSMQAEGAAGIGVERGGVFNPDETNSASIP